MNFSRKLLLILSSALMSTVVYSHHDVEDITDLFALDIEELANFSISVASKREEKVSEAPGIINVITAAEIKQFGANTLFEVLGRLPSVYAYSYPSMRDNAVAFRGQSENIDNHMLLLLNGRPLREGYTGGINAHIYRSFPLDTIDHIEVIRGPGSVLYGTNAFSGVINIITKKAEENLEAIASTSYGSFETWQENVAIGINKGDFNLYGAVKFVDTDGWTTQGVDGAGAFGADNYKEDTHGGMFRAQYKNFTINALLADSNSAEFNVPLTFPLGTYDRRSRFVDADYAHEINDDWKVSLNATYNGYDQDYISGLIVVNEDDVLYEASITGEVTNDLNVLAGFTHNTIKGTFTSFGSRSDYETVQLGGYLQADYRIWNSLKLIAGIQVNKPEDVDEDFSPRLGAIYQINNHWGTKLLYGQAFRAATPVEQFLFLPGAAVGDPGLDPEKIETYEAQLYYNDNKYYAALSIFKSRITNIISINPTTRIYSNEGSISSKGLTLEGKVRLNDYFSLQGSFSFDENKKGDIEDFYATPNIMAKVGLSYDSDNGVGIGVFNSYIGKRSFIKPAREVNPDPDAYNLLTANIRFNLNDLLDSKSFPDSELSLYGNNLLDEDIHAGTPRVNSPNTFPMSSGRAFYGTIAIKF
jgi:outer membrane receptor for ferrienterochelin and colicin